MSVGLVSSMTDRGEFGDSRIFTKQDDCRFDSLRIAAQEHGTYGEDAKTLAAQAGGA
jgi:hypothetical protein